MFFGSIFNLCLLAVINIRIIAAPKSDQPPTGGLDPSFIRGKAPKANEPIIIVGGGLAGLSAAVEALEEGAKVILLDKEKSLGGNSAKASSGINGCGTKAQKAHGIMDTTKLFYDDTMKSGDRENDPILVDLLVDESSSAVQFLTERGADLTAINLCGGHSVPRTHWLPPVKEGRPTPVGIAIIRSLNSTLNKWKEENPDQLEIKLEAKVLGLVTWNDFVTGVRYLSVENKIEEITGKGVILTTGGFSSDFTTDSNSTSLLTEFAPNLVNLPTTNGDFASGDGVKMARAMGAELIGMDRVQVHPTAFIDPKNPGAKTKFLAAEALRGKGAILVNERGRRFGNELGRRDYLTDKINKSCKKVMDVGNLPVSFMLMNKESVDDFGRSAFTFYAKIKGFFMELNGAEQVAREIGCSVEDLTQTLKEHNEFYEQSKADSGFKDPFGKTVFPVKFDPKETIYLARITPALHYTMGGLKIDKHAVVFSEFINKPFQGLLAAGEVTGGVHGRNRLAGNSLLECVVFGRIAGKSAAKINYQRLDGLETTTVNESEHPEL